MAFSASGLYFTTFRDVFDTSQTALNLDATTHMCALHTDSRTNNFSSDTTWANTAEVSSANYTTKGLALTGTSVTESPAGTLMWDSTLNPTWSTVTFTAYGAIVFADVLADEMICAVAFGGPYTATAGTFTLTWNTLGIFTIDLTP